jgi:hypothetical protein
MRNTNKPLTGNELVYERDHMAVVQRDAFRDLGFAEEDRLSELDETIQNITQVLDEFFGSQYLNGRVTYDAIAEGDFGIVYGSGFTRIDFALGAGSRTLVEFIESLFSKTYILQETPYVRNTNGELIRANSKGFFVGEFPDELFSEIIKLAQVSMDAFSVIAKLPATDCTNAGVCYYKSHGELTEIGDPRKHVDHLVVPSKELDIIGTDRLHEAGATICAHIAGGTSTIESWRNGKLHCSVDSQVGDIVIVGGHEISDVIEGTIVIVDTVPHFVRATQGPRTSLVFSLEGQKCQSYLAANGLIADTPSLTVERSLAIGR